MPKKWSEVAASEGYQSLTPSQRQNAQSEYFSSVVAPQVKGGDVGAARSEFYKQHPLPGTADSLAQRVSKVTNIPSDMVDMTTGASFKDRLNYSMADNDEEVKNKFSQKYHNGAMFRVPIPKGRQVTGGRDKGLGARGGHGRDTFELATTRLMFKENWDDPREKWKSVEDQGFSMGDVADMGGPALIAGPTIAAGIMTGGASIPIQMLATGATAALSHTGKEGIEALRGDQLQPGAEVATDALKQGAITAAMVGAGGLATKGFNAATGRGYMNPHPEVRTLLDDVNKMKARGGEVTNPMLHQMAPENMVLNRIGAQAESTSKAAQHHLISQQQSALKAGQEGINSTMHKSGQKFVSIAKAEYKNAYNALNNKVSRVTPRQGQESGTKAIKTYLEGAKKGVTRAYQQADDMAQKENPMFDLSGVMRTGQQIKETVLGIGKANEPTLVQGTPKVVDGKTIFRRPNRIEPPKPSTPLNVADTPHGPLLNVINDIEKLSSGQVNYEVIKQLRTRLGSVIDDMPWQANINTRQARNLYGALSDAMRKPVNGSEGFVKAIVGATEKAKARFDVMGQQSIRTMMSSENNGQLVLAASKPNQMTGDVLKVIQSGKAGPKNVLRFRKGVQAQILMDENGAANAVNNYRRLDPEGYRVFFPKGEEKQLLKVAGKLDDLRNSPLHNIATQQLEGRNALHAILGRKDLSEASMQKLLGQVGPGGRQQLRNGAYEDFVESSIAPGKMGIPTLDKGAMATKIAEYKVKGIWTRVLTKDDRVRLQGLKSYLDIVTGRGRDPGVSLEAAQAITSLKHPSTFLSGVHKLGVNTLLAHVLKSEGAAKFFLGTGKTQFTQNPVGVIGVMADALLEGTEPGSGDSGYSLANPEAQLVNQ